LSAQPLPDQFRLFAQGAARDGATTYDAISRGVADDPDILALIGEAPVAQRRPNLLLAAVHYLLLAGADHPLADHYDTVQLVRGTNHPPPAADHDVTVDFRDFCLEHRAALLELIAVRSTQTNEVGRCAALLPALNVIASRYPDGQPLSLLDLGTSAGLNLLFDSYGYRYRQRSDDALRTAGLATSQVQLECVVRGAFTDLPPLALPAIAERTGIDASPIDPTSDDGARWLLACLWPDNLTRFARLRGALAEARTTPHPSRIVRGDIVDGLAPVVAGLAADGPLVVFHSWVAAYLSEARQAQLVEAVRTVSSRRPVHHLYLESPRETPGLPTPPSPSSSPTAGLATALVHLDADGSAPVRLADVHHHGKWLQWWPTPTDPTGHRDERGPARPRP
jgi:hypothetical protein